MSETTFKVDKEKLEVTIERVFAAPRERIWKVLTDPAAIPQWWGPGFLTTIVDKMEVRVGGGWRFLQRDPEGGEYAFNGEYREVKEAERIVQTFVYEAYPDSVMVETMTLEELPDGRTRLRGKSVFPSIEALEGMVIADMEKGAIESWERLAELLAKVSA
jgi:uncharacterized protein YndB with AHSA1/START domain